MLIITEMLTRKNLGGIDGLHRREREGENDAEHKYERNTCVACRDTLGVLKISRGTSDDRQTNRHSNARSHEHLPAANDIVKASSRRCTYPPSQGVHNIQQQLGIHACDPNILQHDWEVVTRNVVPGKLAEPRHGLQNVESALFLQERIGSSERVSGEGGDPPRES